MVISSKWEWVPTTWAKMVKDHILLCPEDQRPTGTFKMFEKREISCSNMVGSITKKHKVRCRQAFHVLLLSVILGSLLWLFPGLVWCTICKFSFRLWIPTAFGWVSEKRNLSVFKRRRVREAGGQNKKGKQRCGLCWRPASAWSYRELWSTNYTIVETRKLSWSTSMLISFCH